MCLFLCKNDKLKFAAAQLMYKTSNSYSSVTEIDESISTTRVYLHNSLYRWYTGDQNIIDTYIKRKRTRDGFFYRSGSWGMISHGFFL